MNRIDLFWTRRKMSHTHTHTERERETHTVLVKDRFIAVHKTHDTRQLLFQVSRSRAQVQ